MAWFQSFFEACTSGSACLSPFFIIFSYVCIWIGFLLWCIMGTFWATVNIHDIAFTYIGLYHVCDEWKGYEHSKDVMSANDPAALWMLGDVRRHQHTVTTETDDITSRTSDIFTAENGSNMLPTLDETGWSQCINTMSFIAPHNGKLRKRECYMIQY